MTREWIAHFYTTAEHPAGEGYGGYTKLVRAWTKRGALRIVRARTHQRWDVEVRRV